MPEISIVIPYHNRIHTLPRCLNSLATLYSMPVCIIMVDNASTDQSHAFVETFIAGCQNALLHWQHLVAPHIGASYARNVGLAAVRTPWVCFFDSDDELSPAFVCDAMQTIKKQPYDLVLASTTMFWPDGMQRVRPLPKPLTVSTHIARSIINTQCFVARTAWLRQCGGWNEACPIWNDYELGVRMLLARPRIAYLRASYHSLHQHADSLTGQGGAIPLTSYLVVLRCVEQHLATIPQQDKSNVRYALALKVGHWYGLQRRRGRPQDEFDAYDAWYTKLLATLSPIQRAYVRFVCWGTRYHLRGLLRLGAYLAKPTC
ncbi:MAG: glycosyltransferase family 2 protein [Bacteroidales bacterium]|nr:glycosyltransferase family 2 protein [Bacteroidales bacterium]